MKKSKIFGVIIAVLILSLMPINALAEDIPKEEIIEITSFKPLKAEVLSQSVPVGTALSKLNLPKTLMGESASGEEVREFNVTWKSDKKYLTSKTGTYIFTAQVAKLEGYDITATPPTIKVKTKKRETKISGLSTSITKKAGKKLTDKISITTSLDRELRLQMYNSVSKKWETKKTYDIKNKSLTLTYPKSWYSKTKTSWRIYIPASDTYKSYTSKTIKVRAEKAYQNPKGWYKIGISKIKLESDAGYNLKKGSMGLKVSMVQRKLGMGKQWEIMGPKTITRVKNFQKSKGLKATGVVDYKTWKKMGFSDNDWYYKGAYVSPLKLNLDSTRSQHIEAFIANAYRYKGTEYIVGAAGKPKTGIDCSGLVMQSMYATGVNPKPVSVIRHSQPGYEYESRNLWKDSRSKRVAYNKKRRGDLVFYHNGKGTVIHVAIYLGKDKIIEANPSHVKITGIKSSYKHIKGIKRVFN